MDAADFGSILTIMRELRHEELQAGHSIFDMTPAQADDCGRAAGQAAFARALSDGQAVPELVNGKVVFARREPDAPASS